MTDKVLALPFVSGLVMQLGNTAVEWPSIVGIVAIVGTAFFLIADRLGLLKKFNGGSTESDNKALQTSLDGLTVEIGELKTVIALHTAALGISNEELRTAVRQSADMHNWIKVQEEVRKRRVEDQIRERLEDAV